jgi:hypothetical protein
MRRRWIAGFCLFSAMVLPFPVSGEQVPSPTSNPHLRTIQVKVLDLNGKLAPRRQAHLVGLSRGSFRPEPGSASLRHWDFATDAKGRFSIRLGEFDTWNDPEGRPGWGTYALVVDRAGNDAGAVSNVFVASTKNDIEPPSDEWEWGRILSVPPKGMPLVLQAKRGLVLEGHLRDLAHPGRPLAGIAIYTNNDLHADSHTAHGGEILTQSAVTDADGAFTIRHVYPVTFYVGVGGPYGFRNGSPRKLGYWIKTKVKDQ